MSRFPIPVPRRAGSCPRLDLIFGLLLAPWRVAWHSLPVGIRTHADTPSRLACSSQLVQNARPILVYGNRRTTRKCAESLCLRPIRTRQSPLFYDSGHMTLPSSINTGGMATAYLRYVAHGICWWGDTVRRQVQWAREPWSTCRLVPLDLTNIVRSQLASRPGKTAWSALSLRGRTCIAAAALTRLCTPSARNAAVM